MVLPTVLSIYVIPNTKDPMGGWLPSPSRDLWKILCEKRVNKIYQSEKKKKAYFQKHFITWAIIQYLASNRVFKWTRVLAKIDLSIEARVPVRSPTIYQVVLKTPGISESLCFTSLDTVVLHI